MLVVEVVRGSGSRRKVFHHRIKLKKLPPAADPVYVANKLREKYPDVLSEESVSQKQLLRLVGIMLSKTVPPSEGTTDVPTTEIRDKPSSPPVSSSSSHVTTTAATTRSTIGPSSTLPTPSILPAPSKPSHHRRNNSSYSLPDIDLQRVDPSVVVKTKKEMDVAFEANRKKPGDPGFVYNVEVEFDEGTESNEWDD